MVTTRTGSRESTPAASVRSTRTRIRPSSAAPAPIEFGTPTTRARTSKKGVQTARAGSASHAYGVGTQASASRVASRTLQGFASALENELGEQDEIGTILEEQPSTTFLSPVLEEGQRNAWRDRKRSASRDFTPESKVSDAPSSSSSTSPTDLAARDITKSFSNQREGGLRDVPTVHFRDTPENIPTNDVAPVQQGPTLQERLDAVFTTLGEFAQIFFNGAKAFLNNYWKLLLGLLLALTFGSLLATYGIPTLDRILPSSSVSNPHHADTTTTVISYMPAPSPDLALSNKLRHLESRLSHLEDELAKSTVAVPAKTPFNHLSAALGATIIPGLTSPTKRTVSSLLIPLSKLWTPPGMKGPLTALMPWTEPGECWCTPAERGMLAVRAAYPVRARGVTVEHVTGEMLAESGHDLSTAPSVVEIWALSGGEDAGECVGDAPEKGKGWVCAGRMEMRSHAFGAEMGRWSMDLGGDEVVEAQDFAFKILENRGNEKATCLYRVLLHGERA